MEATPGPKRHTPVVPATAGGARDFVSVDDSGAFSYHESEPALIAAFEYVGEAACILDRAGNSYDLSLDPNRHLILGPAHGPAEFHWLRQALVDAREVHPEDHRLRRFYPETPDQLLSDLFETLALEHGSDTGLWILDIDGVTTRGQTLQDVDRCLSGQDQLANVRVLDPFGHVYRPNRHRKHWYLPASAGVILYIEVPPQRGGSGVLGHESAPHSPGF
ncbi:hypothetical protein [Arthrobacter sp. PsM3]|uniref:hypothetical protein n=1 Tax=Arthrobacter sp. PsM3 TaxID=3030531 RepID=UPI00263A6003|nr:hypothetical protein [Arthrobacter sp. PsM3]MDN4645096.1 hypothetical protein [Arthrobacter sp. PsM3]